MRKPMLVDCDSVGRVLSYPSTDWLCMKNVSPVFGPHSVHSARSY